MVKLLVSKAFDAIAEEWNAKYSKPRSWVRLFEKHLKKTDIVLDAGCGNAVNAIALANRVKKIYAIDDSGKMVGIAKENVAKAGLENKIMVEKASVLKLPFDVVMYFAVVHHFAKPSEWNKIFSEMRRVLKPNGLVFITVWQKRGLNGKVLVSFPKKTGERVKRLYYFFEEEGVKRLSEESRFKVKEMFYEKKGMRAAKEPGDNLCLVLRSI